jgi:hypothetical protein
MRRVSHVRNIVVALAVVFGLLLASGLRPFAPSQKDVLAAPVLQTGNFIWSPGASEVTITQGTFVVVDDFRLTNNTGDDGVFFDISVLGIPSSWPAVQISPNPVQLDDGSAQVVNFVVSVPSNATVERRLLTLRATRTIAGQTFIRDAFLTVIVVAPPTQTPIPSATTGPTETPLPACQNGRENGDPGNDRGSAQLILVDVLEAHGICKVGDEDWFKFGAISGKVYTIDVPRMDNGLDLSIDLYDPNGNFITSNDDYYNRPASAGGGPGDTRPQIHSWRAPTDGVYFFRVRDTAGIGGDNTTYDVIVNAESYGPTPTQVPELCQDLYEPDGLPENARLITSNEIQTDHRLCPAGDADWVKFFGKAGKIYYMYTDTRPYVRDQIGNRDPINAPSEAGADTVLYLADRDGVSIIDFNDDIEGSLDSELRFTPPADGFYYAQVKNVGDIGNQFIRYDFSLKLCVPNTECGRSPVSTVPTTQPDNTPSSGQPTTTATVGFIGSAEQTQTAAASGTAEQRTADAQDTAQAMTDDAQNSFSQQSIKPGPLVNGPIRGFADRAFELVWARNDRPIAEQRATRSWAWGPRGLMARTEGYLQANGGLRQVQYFDKARMEVNDPQGDRNSRWFVTTGLLVIELITGKTQIGDGEFVQHQPADIPIAGDADDTQSPTYASFGGVTALFPGDRTGQMPSETLNRAGQVGAYGGAERPETRQAHFVAESGHNIPQVFWQYLNSAGTIYEGGRYHEGALVDWVFTLGYPISEEYWTRIRVGGVEHEVLVQPFQRRVLTYSPDNPSGWQVEMGNVGRHYYRWRYGEELPAP